MGGVLRPSFRGGLAMADNDDYVDNHIADRGLNIKDPLSSRGTPGHTQVAATRYRTVIPHTLAQRPHIPEPEDCRNVTETKRGEYIG